MRRVGWSRLKIRLVRKCYPCLRNEVLPMSPEWTKQFLAERVGFEPTCPCGQDAFEAPPLRPLRYLSVFSCATSQAGPQRVRQLHILAEARRRSAKNACSTARHSASSTPPATASR